MIENFGVNIARLRKEKNMTQKDLADKLGVNKQTISNIEKGEGYPTFKNLEKLSQILNANAIQLFGTMKEIALHDTPRVLDRIDEYHDKVKDILEVEKALSKFQNSSGEPSETYYEITTLSKSIETLNWAFKTDADDTYSNLSTLLPSDETMSEINQLASSLRYLDGMFTEKKEVDNQAVQEGLDNGQIDGQDIAENNIPYITYPPKITNLLPSREKIEEVHRLVADLKYIEKNN